MGRGQHAVYTCFPPFAQYWNKKPGGGGGGGGGGEGVFVPQCFGKF